MLFELQPKLQPVHRGCPKRLPWSCYYIANNETMSISNSNIFHTLLLNHDTVFGLKHTIGYNEDRNFTKKKKKKKSSKSGSENKFINKLKFSKVKIFSAHHSLRQSQALKCGSSDCFCQQQTSLSKTVNDSLSRTLPVK